MAQPESRIYARHLKELVRAIEVKITRIEKSIGMMNYVIRLLGDRLILDQLGLPATANVSEDIRQ